MHLKSLIPLLAAVTTAFASPEPIPPHSRANVYSSGWICDFGYERKGDRCVGIVVPPHAQLDLSRSGWECKRGYREVQGGCAIVQVPADAFLDPGGHGWECKRGY